MYVRTYEGLGQISPKEPAIPGKAFGVSIDALTAYDWAFSGKKSRERFKARVQKAAAKVGINPGLLGENLISEAVPPGIGVYLQSSKVFSPSVGADYFYDTFFIRRGSEKGKLKATVRKKVPAVSEVSFDPSWDPLNPPVWENDARKAPKLVESVWFASGWDALLGHTVILKYFEIRLIEEAKAAGGDFDALPVETRFFLVRLRFNPGKENWKKVLRQVLGGQDVLVRTGRDRPPWPSIRRAATVHAARSIHLSKKVFGQPVL